MESCDFLLSNFCTYSCLRFSYLKKCMHACTHTHTREFMCTSYVKMPTESEEECQIPWNWNCRQVAIRSHPSGCWKLIPGLVFLLQCFRTSQVSPVSAPTYNGSTMVTDVCHSAQLYKSSRHSNSGPTFVHQVLCSQHHLSNPEPQLFLKSTLF